MYTVWGRKPTWSGEERNAPAMGAPVLSVPPPLFTKDFEEKKTEEGKLGDGKNVADTKKISGGKKVDERSDIAAAVKEAGENIMGQGKGTSKVLELVGEDAGTGTGTGTGTTTGKGTGKGKGGK